GSNLRLRMANTQYSTRGYEATYVTTDQGSGCGGELTDSRGAIRPSRTKKYDFDCVSTIQN
ncbi:Cubilinlike, partial [Caligus rogercresseyi]